MNDNDELDAAVATKIMGWTQVENTRHMGLVGYPPNALADMKRGIRTDVPNYSTNIADAWTVVERMRELGWICEVGNDSESPDEWSADFTRDPYIENHVWSYSATAPLAICRAALYALDALPLPAYDSPERWGKR